MESMYRATNRRAGFHHRDGMESISLADLGGFANWGLVALVMMAGLACQASEGEDQPQGNLIRFHIEKILSKPLPEVIWKTRDADLLTTELAEFYHASHSQPAWVSQAGLSEDGEQVMEALRRAPEHGLRKGDYLLGVLSDEHYPANLAHATAESKAAVDVALSFATLRYVKDLHEGRFSPRQLRLGLDVSHRSLDLSEELAELIASDHVGEAIETTAPIYPGYSLLQNALARYRRLVAEDPWQPLADDQTIHPGESYREADLLRHRLRLTGDLEEDAASSGLVYDEPLVAAIQQFQTRHGLKPDGVVGSKTFSELNTPWSNRVAQIVASLERWRWVPEQVEGTPIVVNVPEFRLVGLVVTGNDYEIRFSSRVIVGKTRNRLRTPIFSAQLSYIEFRPFWNVPMSIVTRELSSHMDEPGYLESQDYEIVSSPAVDAKPLPITPENTAKVRTGELRLRQRPGPHNALGLVKFIFPNEYSVLMHSTPAKSLFRHEERAFSHGCVRVADAVGLAEWILDGQGNWDRRAIEKAMSSGPTRRVFVKRPIPVYILYMTAFVEPESGLLHFHDDIYGLDTDLAHALGHEFIALEHGPDRKES